VTVKLLSAIGVNYAINYARNLGIVSPLTPTLALALGASGVTLSELLTAYTPFANMGDRVEPYLIDKVYDRTGRLLEEHQVKRENVISPQTAYIMTHLLEGVVVEGTGRKAAELGRPAAGKTGTTNELKDAWFIGYTPQVLAGVWVGYDDHTLSLGKGETGGHAACPIWLYFMKEWMKDQPVQTFPIPSGVVFARINGQSGSIIRSDEPGGVYAAFAGEIPTGRGPGASEEAYSSSGTSESSSPSESFFKSDLF
jgi:penicillin-binding protein 1A